MKAWKVATAAALLLLQGGILGCVPAATAARVDPAAFITDRQERLNIPEVCRPSYESAIPKVAVAEISNFTTFDYAKTVQAQVAGNVQQDSAGAAAASYGRRGGGVVWGTSERTRFQAEATTIQRDINANLSESVGDGISDVLSNLGGLKLYSRADLKKVLDEQKLQQSGLVEDKDLVQLGKLTGVRYMMTGSIDNVNLSYLSLQRLKDASGRDNNLLNALVKTAMEQTEGWRVETEVNVRMLDVQTGEIVLSKKAVGKQIVGRMPYPTYDQLIGSIKKAVSGSLVGVQADFSKFFTVKGYVIQTKTSPEGGEKIALVSLGQNQKLQPGHALYAYAFEEIMDPLTGKTVCDQQRIPVELVVSDQIQGDRAWCSVRSEPRYFGLLRPGLLVERAPIGGPGGGYRGGNSGGGSSGSFGTFGGGF
ncbi:hypothetical protein GMSM_26390 [Geomonas sp. Red276]